MTERWTWEQLLMHVIHTSLNSQIKAPLSGKVFLIALILFLLFISTVGLQQFRFHCPFDGEGILCRAVIVWSKYSVTV